MVRPLLVLAALLAACGAPESTTGSPPAPRVERFEVPVGDALFFAEVRTAEVVPEAGPEGTAGVRISIRLLREDGTDAGTAHYAKDRGPGWSGVVTGEETEIMFRRLQVEPGVPAPLNAVVLHVKADVGDGNRVDLGLRSNAICIR